MKNLISRHGGRGDERPMVAAVAAASVIVAVAVTVTVYAAVSVRACATLCARLLNARLKA